MHESTMWGPSLFRSMFHVVFSTKDSFVEAAKDDMNKVQLTNCDNDWRKHCNAVCQKITLLASELHHHKLCMKHLGDAHAAFKKH